MKTTVLGLLKPGHGTNVVEGNDPSGESHEAKNLDILDAAIAALQGGPQGIFLVTAPPTDQTIVGGFKLSNTGGFVGPLTGDVKETVGSVITSGGAISAKQGVVQLGSAGALAMSLADPTSGADDGKRLTILAATAHAHIITITGGLQGGTNNTATMTAAVGSLLELEAIAGKWFQRPSIGIALSHV